jgi:SAM-dependent methyltransferase
MTTYSKLCDAADWFDREFDDIVRAELEEEPRLHRKQWEFAQIFRSLRAQGMLNGRTRGLSMGGGAERLLYAVARRAGHLTVTDLYDRTSAWAGAQTDDPDRTLKAAAPFPIDPARLLARRMDMRSLEFGERSFDFCYSSCAIEHIGGRDDFLAHLREVRRVLTDGGLYVLTTEFHYGEEVIAVPNNYYFSAGYLDDLLRCAGFEVAGGVSGALWPHALNSPLPAQLEVFAAAATDGMSGWLRGFAPHVQLLTGGLPFTSVCVVLTKARRDAARGVLPSAGLDASRRFIDSGVRRWRTFVEGAECDLDPFGLSALGGRSPHLPRCVAAGADDTFFHSGYVWLGGAPRSVAIDFEAWPAHADDVTIELVVHRQPTRTPDHVSCTALTEVTISERQHVRLRVPLAVEPCCSYAVLGRVTAGACWVDEIAVRMVPARP